jgi:cobalt-zinc-cadmium efflux system outer membrane protein
MKVVNYKSSIALILLTPSIAFCNIIPAAPTATDTLKLDIAKVEQEFVSRNLSMIAAKYDVDIAKANVLQAKLWYNPNISYSQGLYDPHAKKFFNRTDSGEVDVQIHQLISLAGKHTNAVKLARISAEKQEIVFKDVLRSLKLELYSNFVSLYASQQRIKLYNREIISLTQLITAADQQYKLGSIAGNEVIRLKAELQTTKNESLGIEADLYEAQKNLKILLNYNYQVYIVANELPVAKHDIPTLDNVMTTAEQNRPDLLLAHKEVDFQKINLRYQKSYRLPDLTLGLEYDQASNYIRNYYGIGASMDLPIFNRNQGLVRAAKKQVARAEVGDTLQLNRIRNEVMNSYTTLYRIKQQTDAMDVNYSTDIEQLIDYAIKNYNKRYISLLEFLDQLRTYKNAKLSLIELNSDYYNAVYNLNFTTANDILK